MNKDLIETISLGVLLGGAMLFGLIGRPAEMAVAVAAGSLGLFFSNLEKFESFSAGGVAAKLRAQIAAVSNRVETISGKETEPPDAEEGHLGGLQVEAYGLDTTGRNVVKALAHSNYAWRYPSGVAKDANVSRQTALRSLQWLVDNELANEASGKNGTVYGLSAKGWSLVRASSEL
ncbi:hypothetical protein CK507_02555 [Pseudomonas sp. WN033]|nr:hypothetical protein CK507_02555 [Pseudomonas sp. WN033]